MAISITQPGAVQHISTDTFVYNFTNMPIGEAAADRTVIALVSGASYNVNTPISSVSIGGAAATEIVNASDLNFHAAIYARDIPTGTTANVTVNCPYYFYGMTVALLRMVGHKPSVFHVAEFTGGQPSASLNVIRAGGAVGVTINIHAVAQSWTWNGLTELYDVADGQQRRSSGAALSSLPTTETRNITATTTDTGTSEVAFCVASWQSAIAEEAGLSSGVGTALGSGSMGREAEMDSAGSSTAAAVAVGFQPTTVTGAMASLGASSVFGCQSNFSYPLGLSFGRGEMSGHPQGVVFETFRYGPDRVANFRYGSQPASKLYYNEELIFDFGPFTQGKMQGCFGLGSAAGVGDADAVPAVVTLVDTRTTGSTYQTNFTFADVLYGAEPLAGQRRWLVLVVGATHGDRFREPLSASLSGQNMSPITKSSHNAGSTGATIGVFALEKPTGTQGAVTVTFDGESSLIACALYRVQTIVASGTGQLIDAVKNAGKDPSELSVIVNKGGVVIAGVMVRGAGNPPNATGTGVGNIQRTNPGSARALITATGNITADSVAYATKLDVTTGDPIRIAGVCVSFGP